MSTLENAIAVLHPIESVHTPEAIISPVPWYAIQVRCHAEKNVSLMLGARGFEQYLPLYGQPRPSVYEMQELLLRVSPFTWGRMRW